MTGITGNRYVAGMATCLLAFSLGCQPAANTNTAADSATAPDNGDAADLDSPQEDAVDRSHQVLRHAVFFSFKEDSSDADVKQVVDAFRKLPEKIDSITDFQWGENNSPEGKDDGFTHCFLLTFKDDAGRKTYLPHAAHKAFGDVLRPHMDKVFVIDYWGTPYEPLNQELKHAVFFKFQDDADPEAIAAVEQAFAGLPSTIAAIKTFEWGKNNSPEKHDDSFTHCFMLGFDSEQGREEYLPHPDHKAFGASLGPVLDKVRVLDFWAQK